MKLYLVRHGIAIDRADPACPADPDRHLTAKGVRRARAVSRGLAGMTQRPDAMLTSPYVRAVQTAEIFAATFAFPLDRLAVTDALEPGAPPESLFELLSRIDGNEVMCFGHAPNLDFVLAYPFGNHAMITSLKKAGVACLDLPAMRPPRGTIDWILPPKLLRQAAG